MPPATDEKFKSANFPVIHIRAKMFNLPGKHHWLIFSVECRFLGHYIPSHCHCPPPPPHCDPHSSPKWPREEPRANSLLHEEAVDGFLLPHHLDNLPVQVDKECSPEATGNTGEERSIRVNGDLPSFPSSSPTQPSSLSNSPYDSKGWELLEIKGKVKPEPGFEESSDGL